MNPVSFDDLFDFSDRSNPQKGIDTINELIRAVEGLLQISRKVAAQLQTEMDKVATTAKELQKTLGTAKADGLAKMEEQAKKLASEMEKLAQAKQKVKEKEEELTQKAAKLREEKEKQTKATQAETNSIAALEKEVKDLTAEYNKLNTAEAGNTDKKEKLLTKIGLLNQRLAQQKKELADVKKETQKMGQESSNSANSLEALRARLGRLTAQRNKIDVDTTAFKKANEEVRRLNDQIKKLEAQGGDNRRNVGNYPQTLNMLQATAASAGGAMLASMAFSPAIAAAQLLGQVIGKLFTTFMDFEKQNARLAGVLGKSRSEITTLTKDAERLGATTAFTATQVAELQTEFAKLGFTESEILNATEATLNLALVAGTGLADAAAVAGSTLRGMGLDAKETGRVTDVMAKSFTTSALDMEKFRESMKYVGPIAKAANVSLEETTAMLGVLADSGIYGSQAGTSLRRILDEIAKTGKPASAALKDIAAKGLTVADAADEVGRTAQTALLVLANNTRKMDELTEAYQNAAGAADKFAKEQLNTLSGQITMLESAVDGLMLSIENGNGMLAKFARGTVEFLTEMINAMTSLDFGDMITGMLSPQEAAMKMIAENAKKIGEQKKKAEEEAQRDAEITKVRNNAEKMGLEQLKEAIKGTTDEYKARKVVNDAEKMSMSELNSKIQEVKKSYEESIEASKDATKSIKERKAATEASANISSKLRVMEDVLTDRTKRQTSAVNKSADALKKYNEEREKSETEFSQVSKKLKAMEDVLTERLKAQADESTRAAEALKKYNEERKKAFDKRLQGIDEAYEKLKVERQIAHNGRQTAKLEVELGEISARHHKERMAAIVEYEGYTSRALKEELEMRKITTKEQERQIKLVQDALAEAKKELNLLGDDFKIEEPEDEAAKSEEKKQQALSALQERYERERLRTTIRARKTGKDATKELEGMEKKMLADKLQILKEYDGFSKEVLQTELELLSFEPDTARQLDAIDQVYSYLEERIQMAHDRKIRAIDRELEHQRDMLASEIQLAAVTGQKVDLAEREQRMADLENQRRREERQAIRNQEYLTFLKSLQTYLLANPNNPGRAFVAALRDLGMAKAVAGAFKDGVIDFNGRGTEESDSNLVLISNRESVVRARATKASKQVLTDINNLRFDDRQYRELMALKNMDINRVYVSKAEEIQQPAAIAPAATSVAQAETQQLLRKLDAINRSVQQLESNRIEVDGMLNLIEAVRRGNTTQRNVYLAGQKLPIV